MISPSSSPPPPPPPPPPPARAARSRASSPPPSLPLLLLLLAYTPSGLAFPVAPSVRAFLLPPGSAPAFASSSPRRRAIPTELVLSSRDGDGEDGPPPLESSSSRLEGNRREPTPAEISVMDDMITKLSNAKPYELPNAVSKAIRVVSSPRFFLRIAERAEMSSDDVERARLSALAENLVSTLEAVVSTAEDRLDDRAQMVEGVVRAAAEPDTGEFLVPLAPERLESMRSALLELDPADLDEGFLSTIDAWMNKSHEDGMDGMVLILQKVLQVYAGAQIKRARATLQANVGAAVSGQGQDRADEVAAEAERAGPTPAAALLERLMDVDSDDWDEELRRNFEAGGGDGGGGVSPGEMKGEVQRTIEGVVLGLENGSMAQRVQAEFLRELVVRIETLEQQQV